MGEVTKTEYQLYSVGDTDPTSDRSDIMCGAEERPLTGMCTWVYGHDHPQHVAGDGSVVVAVWTEPRRRAVSIEVARAVLHYFGDDNLGIQAGQFVTRLVRLISIADEANRELLRQVYPEHVEAVRAVQSEHWGLDWLRKIAREVA